MATIRKEIPVDASPDDMLAPPDLRLGRELRPRRKRTAQLAVITAEIEARAEWSPHELPQLAQPVAKGPLIVGLGSITTCNRLEVLRGMTRHIKHVRSRSAQLERTALVIVDVVTNTAEHIDRQPAHPGSLHQQPGRRRHDPDVRPTALPIACAMS